MEVALGQHPGLIYSCLCQQPLALVRATVMERGVRLSVGHLNHMVVDSSSGVVLTGMRGLRGGDLGRMTCHLVQMQQKIGARRGSLYLPVEEEEEGEEEEEDSIARGEDLVEALGKRGPHEMSLPGQILYMIGEQIDHGSPVHVGIHDGMDLVREFLALIRKTDGDVDQMLPQQHLMTDPVVVSMTTGEGQMINRVEVLKDPRRGQS